MTVDDAAGVQLCLGKDTVQTQNNAGAQQIRAIHIHPHQLPVNNGSGNPELNLDRGVVHVRRIEQRRAIDGCLLPFID